MERIGVKTKKDQIKDLIKHLREKIEKCEIVLKSLEDIPELEDLIEDLAEVERDLYLRT